MFLYSSEFRSLSFLTPFVSFPVFHCLFLSFFCLSICLFLSLSIFCLSFCLSVNLSAVSVIFFPVWSVLCFFVLCNSFCPCLSLLLLFFIICLSWYPSLYLSFILSGWLPVSLYFTLRPLSPSPPFPWVLRDFRKERSQIKAQDQLDMQNDWNRQKDRDRRGRPDVYACHSASPHKDKPRSCAQGAGREKTHSETDKSRDVGERD